MKKTVKKKQTQQINLQWKQHTKFPDDYVCIVGYLDYTACTNGIWDISLIVNGQSICVLSGRAKSGKLSAAKAVCQRHINAQWKAMQRFVEVE